MDLHATGRFAGMEIAEIPLKLVFGCLNNRARSVRLRPSLEPILQNVRNRLMRWSK